MEGEFMKKIHRLAISMLSLSLIFCSCFHTDTSANSETQSQTSSSTTSYDGPLEREIEGGFSRRIDPDTQTVTLQGSGVFPVNWVLHDYKPKTIVIGPEITGLEDYAANAPTLSYKVDPENPYLASYDGCLYTKDYKKLLSCPTEKKTIDFHPNLEIVGENSLIHTNLKMDLVIPWGVTTLEGSLFSRIDVYNVYLPDTLLNLNPFSGSEHTAFYCSPFLYQRLKTKYGKTSYWLYETEAHGSIPTQRLYEQYGVKPNSLKVLDGKAYYFNQDYSHPVGWKQVAGDWYYFNDYGAAVVKIWLKSGNKWYFMQADGTMAKNKWIQWYGKWYYVGSDGAMYANRYTPDGCWVNGSGVWVK